MNKYQKIWKKAKSGMFSTIFLFNIGQKNYGNKEKIRCHAKGEKDAEKRSLC